MEEFRRLVVGIELAPRTGEVRTSSLRAAQQAVWLAAHNGGELTLVHSTWDGRDEPAGPPGDDARQSLATLAASAEAAGAAAQVEFDEQRPWLALARRSESADMILAGKRDESERRLGPTAGRLLRKCAAPVWLVEPGDDVAHRLVLAATDLTAVGDRSVAAAAWIADRCAAELHVVHGWRIPRALQAEASNLDQEEYAARVDALREPAAAALEHATEGLPVDPTLHLKRGPADKRIRDRVEHLQPDLVVMGSLSTAGRPGLFVGETAERVLPRLNCSILALKPGDFQSPCLA